MTDFNPRGLPLEQLITLVVTDLRNISRTIAPDDEHMTNSQLDWAEAAVESLDSAIRLLESFKVISPSTEP
jgi:hypothetical protein